MRGKRWLITAFSILGSLAICSALCLFGAQIYFEAYRQYKSQSPGQSALRLSEDLLTKIQDYPGQTMRNNMPSRCWELLPPAMAANSNHYKLTIADESYPDSLPFHESTTASIHAEFPDGTRIQMFYYQGYLAGCDTLKPVNDSTPLLTVTPP